MPECIIGNVKIHVEVPVLLIFFGLILSESVSTNLIIFRSCYVILGYNKSECALLGSNYNDNVTENLEKLVQPTASVISMTNSLITSITSVILCLFVGTWSDRFGRKPILIIPVIGFFLSYIALAVFASLTDVSPWYILLCSIPGILTGGGSCFLTVLFSYITDVTSEANRGLKMGIFEAVLSLGIFLGNISSSYIFAALNYSGVFLISAGCCLLAVLFTIFLIPESLTNIESEGRLQGLFQISNIGDMVKCTFKKRPNYDRCAILCCVLILSLFILIINGDGAVIFLFLREKFDFSLQTYTLYNAAHNLTWVLGTLIGVYGLHKLLKIPETILILVGLISMLNSSLIQALADRRWEIYAAAFIRSPAGPLSPMIRSLVSKIVPNADVGKIFAMIITSESLFGMTGNPIFTAIYNSTLKFDAGIFNFLSAGIYSLGIIMAIALIAMRTLQSKEINYNEIKSEENREENSETVSVFEGDVPETIINA